MNIFAVDRDPRRAARCLGDRHVVKMTLETAQILCTVARLHGHRAPYRSTHVHHPCVVWAAERHANFRWLVLHGLALAEEYERRFGRKHRSGRVIGSIARRQAGPPKDGKRRSPFALAMPEQYRGRDAVASYRRYYRGEKARLVSYRAPARAPRWWR
jgi:hypothetical protein